MNDGIEREVKLEVDADFVLPALDADATLVVEVLEPRDLDAVYYDSAYLFLLGSGITMRRRTGEGTRWTVKFPTAEIAAARGLARREIDVMDEATDPPAAVLELVASYLGGTPLEPVARLVSHRERLALTTTDGLPVAEIDDDSVTVHPPAAAGTSAAAEPMGFREVEVEFGAEADPEVIEGVVAQLRAAGARPASSLSKLDHALHLLGRPTGRWVGRSAGDA